LDVLLARLKTNPATGLDAAGVEEKYLEFGDNVLTPPKQTPEWVKFLREVRGGIQTCPEKPTPYTNTTFFTARFARSPLYPRPPPRSLLASSPSSSGLEPFSVSSVTASNKPKTIFTSASFS
jgi:hypothetical protein